MPAILTSDFSVINAENFVDSFVNGSSNVYIAVGRGDGSSEEADAVYHWDDETNPPTPIDTIEQLSDFRNNVIGIKRVMISNIMIMVPRITWKEGMKFSEIHTDAVSGKRATDYYCVNSNNDVYLCTKAGSGVTMTGSEPTAHGSQTTGDGYTWEFLYNITTAMVNGGMLLENWMPVPFNKHAVYETGNTGTITETQYQHGDMNANQTLGAYRVLISCTLSNEGEVIPYTARYRQVGMIIDPKNKNGDFLEGDLYAPGEGDEEWLNTSGSLVYLENRKAVYREVGQQEVVELILVF